MWHQKEHVVTSLLYSSLGLACLRLKYLTLPLHVHVIILLHLICKLSNAEHTNLRNKNGRTYPVTLIMMNNSKAAQEHLDTMNDITIITHTASTAVNKATARQSRIH